eukprot:TRINITY_DN18978_c0_g2_i1.p1 TRINITY_DN18978_c0_g2~~TRINITY_DN18978_c0_g2_i1.p1  ORF type:complete len:834 (+),score=106.06 TRINITY_DN18978_c0_g2_i1:41-2503(+)
MPSPHEVTFPGYDADAGVDHRRSDRQRRAPETEDAYVLEPDFDVDAEVRVARQIAACQAILGDSLCSQLPVKRRALRYSDLPEDGTSLSDVALGEGTCRYGACTRASGLRRKCIDFFERQVVDTVMGCVVLLNISVLMIEVDSNADCARSSASCSSDWGRIVESALVGVYSIEMLLRLATFGIVFFLNRWNILDLFVVMLAYVELIVAKVVFDGTTTSAPSDATVVQILRFLRIARLLRALRLFVAFPGLHHMVQGLVRTLLALKWGFIVVAVTFATWSIISVEYIHPLTRTSVVTAEACQDMFGSVFHSSIMLFNGLIGGEAWGGCITSMMKEQPGTSPLFVVAIASVRLGFAILVLLAISEISNGKDAADSRRRDDAKRQLEELQTVNLKHKMRRTAKNLNGSITLREILNGYKHNRELRIIFDDLDIEPQDICAVFQLLDVHGSGEIPCDGFVQEIRRAQTQDMRMQLLVVRLQATKVIGTMQKQVENLSRRIHGLQHHDTLSRRSDGSNLWSPRRVQAALQQAYSGTFDAAIKSKEYPEVRSPKKIDDDLVAFARAFVDRSSREHLRQQGELTGEVKALKEKFAALDEHISGALKQRKRTGISDASEELEFATPETPSPRTPKTQKGQAKKEGEDFVRDDADNGPATAEPAQEPSSEPSPMAPRSEPSPLAQRATPEAEPADASGATAQPASPPEEESQAVLPQVRTMRRTSKTSKPPVRDAAQPAQQGEAASPQRDELGAAALPRVVTGQRRSRPSLPTVFQTSASNEDEVLPSRATGRSSSMQDLFATGDQDTPRRRAKAKFNRVRLSVVAAGE